MNIRFATPEDAPAISGLAQVVQQIHANGRPDFFKPASEATFSPETVLQRMAQAGTVFLVAEVDGRPVGYALLEELIRAEDSIRKETRWLHIDQMSIQTEYQGRGIGRAFVERTQALARERGLDQVVLSTWNFNRHALRAFYHLGFRPYLHRMLLGVEQPVMTPQAGETASVPVSRDATVSLREVNQDNLYALFRLSDTLQPPQVHMVAHNAKSIAEAHFEPRAWFRAIYAGETPVGFCMLYLGNYDHPDQAEQEDFIWRYMIGTAYQSMGFGRKAMDLLVEFVRARGGKRLALSCHDGEGSPEGFYHAYGFRRDGRIFDDEIGMVMDL